MSELDRVAPLGVPAVRLFPEEQHVEPDFPAVCHVARHATVLGLVVLSGGDVRRFWRPYAGLGARVVEPCFSRSPAARVAEVVAAVDDRQLLFGTDATLIDPACALGSLIGAGVHSGPAAERIAWRNAADLFGLPV